NKPISEIEASLLPTAKTARDELVWWAKATMAAMAAEA
ncbi:FMN reductase, partial [Sinorhizobium meliloti]|nr:FMN reductase [Sinorhizobium meliloti]